MGQLSSCDHFGRRRHRRVAIRQRIRTEVSQQWPGTAMQWNWEGGSGVEPEEHSSFLEKPAKSLMIGNLGIV